MISPHPPRCARPPLPQCAGLSGENFPAIDTCAGLHGNELKPSCADLIRASTPLYRPPQGVDGRVEPGQDEIGRRIPSLGRRQIFPRTALRTAGEGGPRPKGWVGEGGLTGHAASIYP